MADVTVVIGVDNKGAITGMKQVSGAATEIEKNSTKAGSALADVAKIAGGFVLAQGLMKLPGLLSGFIGGASDLNESLSKVRTVFGENAKEIESWASTAAKSLGMSKGAALEAAGTFGNFLQAMGATSPAATKMSKDMVQLATDLGSFNNADPTEVLLALRSGLSGEAEPLRKFGVAISAAAVEAKALQLGLKGVGGELTEQEKIQARYAIIMEQTTMAQGDFERTSGGLANQTKILKAMFKDAGDTLGTALLPGIVAIMGTVIQLVPWVVSLGSAIGEKLKGAFDLVAGGIKTFVGDVKWLIENGGSLMDIVAGDNEPTFWQKLAFAVAEAWPVLKDIAGLAWDGIKVGVDALAKLAGLAWDGVEKAVKAIAEFAKSDVLPRIESAAKALSEIAQTNLGPLITQIQDLTVKLKESGSESSNWATAWDKTTAALKPAKDALAPIVNQLLDHLSDTLPIITDGTKGLAEAFKDLWEAVKPLHPVLEPLGKLIGGAIVAAFGSMILAIDGVVSTINLVLIVAFKAMELAIKGIAWEIDRLIEDAKGMAAAFGAAWGAVAKVFEANVQIIVGLFAPLMKIGEGIVSGIVDGIWAGAGRIKDAAMAMVKWIEDAIPDWIPHSPSVAGVNIGQGLIFGIAKGIEDTVDELDASLTGIAVKFEGFGANLVDMSQQFGRDIFESYDVDKLKSLYDNVPDYVKKLSPAAGGSKGAAGTPDDYMTQYQGGGQYGYIRVNDKQVGDAGPNGTKWDGEKYVQWAGLDYAPPGAAVNNRTGAPPIVINVGTINARDAGEARMAAHDIAYTLATSGLAS